MTVTVRPVPQRVARNGIRPFRPVVPTNNLGPVTIKNWRPPVPEPLPPAPLIGPKGLLALGVLVLGQIWGAIASRPAVDTSKPPQGTTQDEIQLPEPSPSGAYDVVIFYDLKGKTFGGNCGPTISGNALQGQLRKNYATSNPSGLYWEVTPASADCDGSHAGKPNMYTLMAGPSVALWTSGTSNGYSADYWEGDAPVFVPVWPGEDPQFPATFPDGFVVPQPETETETAPAVIPRVPVVPPAPLPLIPGTPGEPRPEISPTPTTPGPTTPPATVPAVPRRTFPIPLREASPTQDGALVPQTPAPVAVTPPDAHFPVPGAPPVTGNGPRPTPEGIAQELGRLEQKVARLSNPQTDATGDASDRIGLALKLLGDIVEFFNSITAGGGYALSSPCEVDEAGNRIPVQVNYAGAPTALGVISNKLDAVAALLQVHKDLKQPICRQTPAVGESVTVQFVQVD